MIKKSITVQELCDFLNSLLEIDQDCISKIFLHREKCNDEILNHETVQVRKFQSDEFATVGIIGILNGVFGIDENGSGAIYCEVDIERNLILQFKTN